MSTDFFDEDLVKTTRPGSSLRPSLSRDSADVAAEKKRLQDHEEQILSELTGTARELEELRIKRSELEQTRVDLEEVTRKQRDYIRRKRDVINDLDHGLESLARRESEAARLLELIDAVRHRYAEARQELKTIDDTAWESELFEDELERALQRVDDAETVFRAGESKLHAEDWSSVSGSGRGESRRVLSSSEVSADGISAWFKAGLAFSIAPTAVLILVWLAWWLMDRGVL